MNLRQTFCVALLACAIPGLGQTGRPCRIAYENENQIDYASAPRVGVTGFVADAHSVPIANACVAIFTEKEHRFVVGRMSDRKGNFALPLLPDGYYRLVVKSEGFGVANMKLKIVPETYADALLYVHMVGRRIDTTSYIDTKKKTAAGSR